MQIIYTAEFIHLFKKLSQEIKKEAFKKESIFKKNPFDSKLKTHKLKGKLKDCWAFSISYNRRVIIEFAEDDVVYFHSIGTHDIYK